MAFTDIDEKALVRAYQAGNERAFDTIVRTQYNALYAHALRRLSQREAAEDAVQDTLLRAYRALPNLDGDLALRAWLHRILTNVCHDEGNRRRRAQGLVDRVSALPEDFVDDPADEAVLYDTVRVMSEALAELPESYREALVLRYVDGLSFREVAEVTGVTEENARARVHRGRGALHKIMARLALMLAFIIPGLRRTQTATPAPGADTAVSDHAVNLTTQLTSHVMTSAPAVSRFAEMAGSMPSGTKSAIAAAAVTAVAAVSVPVAVHTVREAQRPDRPAPAVAAPSLENESEDDGGLTAAGTDPKSAATTTSTTTSTETTSTTLPLSQTHPFEAYAGTPNDSTTSTTAPPRKSTTTSTTVAPAQGTVVRGDITTTNLSESGEAPQWDIEGDLTLTVGDKVRTGTISGRVYVYDDGTASADQLTLVVAGHTLQLRFRGDVTDVQKNDGTTTYQIVGAYLLTGASQVGLADRGDVTSSFGVGRSPSLVFKLSGRSSS